MSHRPDGPGVRAVRLAAASGWRPGAGGRLALLACVVAAAASCGSHTPQVLFTADTEGTTGGCSSCGASRTLGELSRRAFVVDRLRRENPGTLLVDAGNALVGADSLASAGRVIVEAYNALSYDVVNLSYADFRLGKRRTLEGLATARFSAVSASLIDAATGRTLVAPYAVKTSGAMRFAFLGITEPPAGVDAVPHLLAQLAGIRVRPAAEALSEWLPRAQREADRVILLYSGSAQGLGELHRAFGPRVAALLVAGLRPGDVSDASAPPIAATGGRGTQIGIVRWNARGGVERRQADIDATSPRSAEIDRLIAAYAVMP